MGETRRDPFRICGTTIADKYRIESVVGAGGFGVVYRGLHEGFGGEPIAVKCLLVAPELTDEERSALLGTLREEAKVLHRLSRRSPSIVQALDVGAFVTPHAQWVPYLVLEWLEGRTLADELARRREAARARLPLTEVMDILEPVAGALALAHRHNVAHRDVKPENIYLAEVDGEKTTKLLDFGIAKVLSEQARFTASPVGTRQAPSAFTPQYGAPEQFNKRRGATGPWTDVFALGLILFEMLTGERALEGDDPAQLYVSACNSNERPSLRDRGVTAGAAVEAVLTRALAVEPEARYSDAAAFWHALCEAVSVPDRVSTRGSDAPTDTGEFIVSAGIVVGAPHPGSSASGPAAFAVTETSGLTRSEAHPADTGAASANASAADAGTSSNASVVSVSEPAPNTTSSPFQRFEVAVIELASKGTPLTLANVVAALGIELAQAEVWLERMTASGRLETSYDDSGLASYRVRGLSLAPRPTSMVAELGRMRDPLFRWLAIDPGRPPGVPPFLRKNPWIAVGLGTALPGVGLLYVAPFWSAMLVLVLSSIIIGLAASLPLIGVVVRWALPALVAATSGFFGWVYAWHFNRNGWRTTLRGARAARDRLRASQTTLRSAGLPEGMPTTTPPPPNVVEPAVSSRAGADRGHA